MFRWLRKPIPHIPAPKQYHVCGGDYYPKVEYIVQHRDVGGQYKTEAMNCPTCGCRIELGHRYSVAEKDNEP